MGSIDLLITSSSISHPASEPSTTSACRSTENPSFKAHAILSICSGLF